VEVEEVEILTLQVVDQVKQVVQVVEQVKQKILETRHQQDLIQEEQVCVVKEMLVVIHQRGCKMQELEVEDNHLLEHL